MRSSIGLTLSHRAHTHTHWWGEVCFLVWRCVHVSVICSRPEHPERCGCPSCCLFQMPWWGHCSGQWAQWTWTRHRWLRRRKRMWAEGGCRSLLHLCCEKNTSTNRFHWNTQDTDILGWVRNAHEIVPGQLKKLNLSTLKKKNSNWRLSNRAPRKCCYENRTLYVMIGPGAVDYMCILWFSPGSTQCFTVKVISKKHFMNSLIMALLYFTLKNIYTIPVETIKQKKNNKENN